MDRIAFTSPPARIRKAFGRKRECHRCRHSRCSPTGTSFETSSLESRTRIKNQKLFIQAELESPTAATTEKSVASDHSDQTKRVLVQQQAGFRLGLINTYSEKQGKLHIEQENGARSHPDRGEFSFELIKRLLTSAFLPTNYPHSVTASYAPYAFWHFLHNTLTACNGVLGTTALLVSAGVVSDPTRAMMTSASADAAAQTWPAAASAATSWILKDGVGHFVRLAFGSRYAHRFDGDLKRLRVLADVLWHLGTGLELVSRSFPQAFIGWASGAYALKGMAHVVFNSTRSTIYRTVAKRSNIGDVTAKGDAQSIAAELLGMAIGLALFQSVARQSLVTTWVIFGLVVGGQMVSRIRSMRVLVLPILNFQRAVLLMDAYVQGRIEARQSPLPQQHGSWTNERSVTAPRKETNGSHFVVLSPEQIAQMECFLHWRNHWSVVPELAPDVPVSWFTNSPADLASLLDSCRMEPFVVGRCQHTHRGWKHQRVGLVMKRGASAKDVLRALAAAIFLVRQPRASVSDALSFASVRETEALFIEAASRGWQLDVVHGLGDHNVIL
jgi:hypothetical protein